MARALLVIDVQEEYLAVAMPVTHPVEHLEATLRVKDASREPLEREP